MRKLIDIWKEIILEMENKFLITDTNEYPRTLIERELMRKTQITNKTTLYNNMNILEELGYIKFLNRTTLEICDKQPYIFKSKEVKE
jgi:Fe2+ or Zn2+ uptake regulation protein